MRIVDELVRHQYEDRGPGQERRQWLGDEFELLGSGHGGIDPADLEFGLNEWDEFSLEAGLQIRDLCRRGGADRGHGRRPRTLEEALPTCLAKGADRAVRVWSDELEGDDPLVVARVLAAALKDEAPDLVLCGVQSSGCRQRRATGSRARGRRWICPTSRSPGDQR